MNNLNDLLGKISSLNPSEKVEYNRRLQSAKASKELSSSIRIQKQQLEKSLKIYVLISNFFKIIFFIILSLVFIFSFKLNEQTIWLALAIGWAVILLLLDTKVHSSQTKLAILDQQEAIVEREWSAIGLEISFLHAILEMEASMKNADPSLKNLQNISSAQAERKRTLSHYDYQIRNEILVNIQSEKNWWSKIDVISNRWFNLK
jgi:hypothetical protein